MLKMMLVLQMSTKKNGQKWELLKIYDGKKITCAVVIIDKCGAILGCHPTTHPNVYDFPKGCAGFAETDIDAAVRELREETGIVYGDEEKSQFIDCGIYPHLKDKNIHIFIHKVDKLPELDNLKCTSYFDLNGEQTPEVDGYAVIGKEHRDLFMKCLQNKFEIIDNFFEDSKNFKRL